MKHRKERNWSQYNQKLKNIARIDFYISNDAIHNWYYNTVRAPGGKIKYNNHAIELCLIMREFYQLAYRQTQGLVESTFKLMQLNLSVPDYTTLSRRSGKLDISLSTKNLLNKNKEAIVVAIDSTGLSIYSAGSWNRKNNRRKEDGYNQNWRKLHVSIDIHTGEILSSSYSRATVNDCTELPKLLESIPNQITSVCADMAYDTVNCRAAIKLKKARQLIPPKSSGVSSGDRKKYINKSRREILKERDEAINYIKSNTINGDSSLAKKSWKAKVGYHARSLVETTMWQIKSHCSDRLSNKREDSRGVQAKIKCKIINIINAA